MIATGIFITGCAVVLALEFAQHINNNTPQAQPPRRRNRQPLKVYNRGARRG